MILNPYGYYNTNKGFVLGKDLKEGYALKSFEGHIKMIKSIKSIKKEVISVELKNGMKNSFVFNTLVLSDNNKLKQIRDLEIGDYIALTFENYIKRKGEESVGWLDQLKGDYTPIKIPEKMSKDLALWLGMMTARGRKHYSAIGLEFTNKEKYLEDLFVELTYKLFHVTLDKIESNGRYYREIASVNLNSFVKSQLGGIGSFKRIPPILRKASSEEIAMYIKGISLKGCMSAGQPVVYIGESYQIMNFLASFLSTHGCYINLYKQKNSSVLYLKVQNKIHDYIDFLDHLTVNNKYRYKIYYKDHIKDIKIPSNHPKYEVFSNIKRNKNGLSPLSSLLKFKEIKENKYFVPIKEIYKENKKMIDVEFYGDKSSFIVSSGILIK